MWVKTEKASTSGRYIQVWHLALSWAIQKSKELLPAKYLEYFIFLACYHEYIKI